MCLCDPVSGNFLSANAALCEFFGRSDAELLACTWQQLTHPDDLAADQQLAARLRHGDFDQYRLRKRFLRADGSTIWGDLTVSCTRHADGSIRDLIGQISDVSELVEQAAYLQAAGDAGVVGIWDWDIRRDQVRWDPVMYRLYGVRAEEFENTFQAWERSVHPDDKAFVLGELEAARRGWREYRPRFRVIWSDGSIHHLQARSRTSYGPDGTALRMIGVNYDITEQVEREQELEEQRRLLATTFDALVDPLLFLSLESSGPVPPHLRIGELNPAAAGFFHRSEPQLVGQELHLLLPVGLNESLHSTLLQVAQGGPPALLDDYPLQLAEWLEPLHVDLRAVAIPQGLVMNFRDVSARRRAVRELAASEERYRLLAENASDVVFRADLSGVTEWITASVTPLLGWTPAELEGHTFAPFVHPDDLDLLADVDDAFRRGERRQFHLRVRHKQGGYRWVSVNARGVRNGNGEVEGLVGSWRDAQREVESELELEHRARTDPLTDLLNRNEILERLRHLASSRRHGDGAVAVLFCDIDHFKEINDRHGHSGGDAVLQSLAERLRGVVRQGDLVGRLGGDELLVLLPAEPSLEAAEAIARKIHAAACVPLQLASGTLHPTLSIGVSLIGPDEPIDAVVARADAAMYAAKQSGRNRVISFA